MTEYVLQPSPRRTSDGINTPVRTYAEKLWTPFLRIASDRTGITYSVQSGSYVQIGSLVVCFLTTTFKSTMETLGVGTRTL